VNGRVALQNEMRRLLRGEPGSDPLAIDQDTADRLLAGRLDAADAPPEYAEVARVLEAAAAPPVPDELRGEATAMAAFASARLDPPGAVSHAAPWRRRAGSKLAVAVAAGVLMIGGVAAAATGTLPEPAQRVVDSVSRTAHHLTPWSPPLHRDGGRARSSGQDGRPAVNGGQDSGHRGRGHPAVGAVSTGPGATGQARRDACGASSAGNGGARGKARSAASQAAVPAGGAGQVDDSCKQGALPGRHASAPGSDLRHPTKGEGVRGERPSGRAPEGEGRAVPPRG
jgi:hypothetical protein